MKRHHLFCRFSLLTGLILMLAPLSAVADDQPMVSPTLTVVSAPSSDDSSTSEGQQQSYSGSAPAQLLFEANPASTDGWTCNYEWHFFHESDTTAYLVRHEEETEYTFTESGTHRIQLWATFTRGDERVEYGEDYYNLEGGQQLTVSISESDLSFPNAFSPNGDGYNDTYHAKAGYKSIVEFHATIFNRWGQKIYSWDDPAGGWDGTFNGKPVKEGVYYVLVKARGADGRVFNIKRDVNLLRGYNESTSTNE